MKKALLLVFAALMVPSVALAAKPSHAHSKTPPQVAYRFSGTLSNYTPYVTGTNGSITILVKHANRRQHALKGQSLTFPVDANTKIHLADGVTAITNGDRGGINVRAAKRIAPADLAATLQLSPARQIHDNGVKTP